MKGYVYKSPLEFIKIKCCLALIGYDPKLGEVIIFGSCVALSTVWVPHSGVSEVRTAVNPALLLVPSRIVKEGLPGGIVVLRAQ